MKLSSLIPGRRLALGFFVTALSLMCQSMIQTIHPIDNTEQADAVESFIQQLRSPAGKVKYLFSINPGGPVFDLSVPMKTLVKYGNTIQPRLLVELKDPRVRNEVALILAEIGDQDALPHLIELLPTKEEDSSQKYFRCLSIGTKTNAYLQRRRSFCSSKTECDSKRIRVRRVGSQ
jgi:hypothetical protein